jgi:hypothetical protein
MGQGSTKDHIILLIRSKAIPTLFFVPMITTCYNVNIMPHKYK